MDLKELLKEIHKLQYEYCDLCDFSIQTKIDNNNINFFCVTLTKGINHSFYFCSWMPENENDEIYKELKYMLNKLSIKN